MKNAKKHVASDPPTAKGLSQLVIQFIEMQETYLGRKAKNAPLVRLPVRLFYDFSTKGDGGSLCNILLAMYKYKTDQGWRRFDKGRGVKDKAFWRSFLCCHSNFSFCF